MADLDLGGGTLTAGAVNVPGLTPTTNQIATSYRSGLRYHSPGATASALNWSAQQSTQWATPIDVGQTITIVELAVQIVTGGASGSVVRLGIMNDSGDHTLPGTVLLDAGTTVSDTTQNGLLVAIGSLSQVLTAGRYWLTGIFQSAAPPTNMYGLSSPVIPLGSAAANPFSGSVTGYQKTGQTGALATWGSGTTSVSTPPAISMKVA
jgi:hypothetical protein